MERPTRQSNVLTITHLVNVVRTLTLPSFCDDVVVLLFYNTIPEECGDGNYLISHVGRRQGINYKYVKNKSSELVWVRIALIFFIQSSKPLLPLSFYLYPRSLHLWVSLQKKDRKRGKSKRKSTMV